MTNANKFFETFIGSEKFHRYGMATEFIYTEGVKAVVEKCEAYWFLDLIISHQMFESVSKEPFQVWTLKRLLEFQFIALATDGNDNWVSSQKIPFSDFPYDSVTIWLVDKCLLLPSEY